MTTIPHISGKEVRFEVTAAPGDKVFVAGTFNNWNPKANPLKDNPDSGHFKTVLRVSEGKHEYKFVINGVWSPDPNCPNWTPNEYGSLNSLIQVR